MMRKCSDEVKARYWRLTARLYARWTVIILTLTLLAGLYDLLT